MSSESLNLPRELFEPVISLPVELSTLEEELVLDVFDLTCNHEIRTCYGDICKIVNALRDYSRLLRMVCDEWDLQGYHRAVYELHAETLENISLKFQDGIGYDYDKAVEKCRKRTAKQDRDDEPGGEAMAMAYLKAKRAAEAKTQKYAESRAVGEDDSLWTAE